MNAFSGVLLLAPRWLWSTWKRMEAAAHLRSAELSGGRHHGLPHPLILSLTSYPARFPTLHLTLRSLLAQSIKADRIVLWIAQADKASIPADVKRLRQYGLEIRACEDLRSFKKLVPALEAFPDAYIVTADDDVYYARNWLEGLVDGVDPQVPAIVCGRAVRLVRSEDGKLAPFLEWQFRVTDDLARAPSADIMAEGAGGVLYPPRALNEIVSDRERFERLCPTSDDLWFYWCARMAGTLYKKVGGKSRQITWAGSENSSLWHQNKRGGNDRAIRALEKEFGPLP
jgi:hypothetical protein